MPCSTTSFHSLFCTFAPTHPPPTSVSTSHLPLLCGCYTHFPIRTTTASNSVYLCSPVRGCRVLCTLLGILHAPPHFSTHSVVRRTTFYSDCSTRCSATPTTVAPVVHPSSSLHSPRLPVLTLVPLSTTTAAVRPNPHGFYCTVLVFPTHLRICRLFSHSHCDPPVVSTLRLVFLFLLHLPCTFAHMSGCFDFGRLCTIVPVYSKPLNVLPCSYCTYSSTLLPTLHSSLSDRTTIVLATTAVPIRTTNFVLVVSSLPPPHFFSIGCSPPSISTLSPHPLSLFLHPLLPAPSTLACTTHSHSHYNLPTHYSTCCTTPTVPRDPIACL
uniref:Uncharacterized protein n=1 Tax=Lygus hesperus TaxID=30085 RepID=A0A146KWI1_LYGHE